MHILEQAIEKERKEERPFDVEGLVKALQKYPLPQTPNESTA
jgi:hypothetical protein